MGKVPGAWKKERGRGKRKRKGGICSDWLARLCCRGDSGFPAQWTRYMKTLFMVFSECKSNCIIIPASLFSPFRPLPSAYNYRRAGSSHPDPRTLREVWRERRGWDGGWEWGWGRSPWSSSWRPFFTARSGYTAAGHGRGESGGVSRSNFQMFCHLCDMWSGADKIRRMGGMSFK